MTDKFSDDPAVNDEFFGQFSHRSLGCDGANGDVVVASRLQLFRNVAEHPFVGVSSEDQRTAVRDRISDCITRSPSLEDLPIVDSDQLREIERQFLLELQSVIKSCSATTALTEPLPTEPLPEIATNPPEDAVAIDGDSGIDDTTIKDEQQNDVSFEEIDFPKLGEPAQSIAKHIQLEDQIESVFFKQLEDATSLAEFEAPPFEDASFEDASFDPEAVEVDDADGRSHEISITINDEDHLRLQVLAAGYPLNWMWDRISRIDDQFEESLNYAYSPQWGYLSSSPANVGTGMRVTVLLHLPALATLGRLDAAFMALMREGVVGRGVYGEEAWGDFFRIGNQVTLGKSESSLINLLIAVVPPLVQYERAARKLLFRQYAAEIKTQTEDASRALKLQVQRSDEELLTLISTVRLGIALGMVSDDQAVEVHSNFELTRLKRKLEVAVKMEHYASATKYRDQIRQLEQRHYGH